MADISSMTGKTITEKTDGEVKVTVQREPPEKGEVVDQIYKATGLKIAPDELNLGSSGEPPKPVREASPELKPVHVPGGGFGIVGADEAAKLGLDSENVEVLDSAKMAVDERKARVAKADKAEDDALTSMFSALAEQEQKREDRMSSMLDDEETRKEIFGDASVTTNRVTYGTRRRDDRNISDADEDEIDDLVPNYEDDIEEESNTVKRDPTKETEVETPEEELTEEEENAERIRSMISVQLPENDNTPVTNIRDEAVAIVPASKDRVIGDQAFMNAVSKFKQDNFGKVTVPLVNSGFLCDIVGIGVVDLQNLYLMVDQNTNIYDYQLEQMKVIIKNVTGTSPRVDRNKLRDMIHFVDYQIMSFGLICATLREVETVTNCQECGQPFRITSRPNELLMNMNELQERRIQIENAANIEEYSLMTNYHVVQTKNGIEITLGHPSYAQQVRCIQGLKRCQSDNRLSSTDKRRIEDLFELISMIRKIRLPSGVVANNVYQIYILLGLLKDSDMTTLANEVQEMQKDIIVPKFGIPEVVCPHCKHVNKDIPYDSLLDLVFFHTTVNRYLNTPPKKKQK